MADLELLKKLSGARGISGREDCVREIILNEIRPLADKIEITPLGDLIAFQKGKKRPRKRLMLDAHMDEAGLIVTHITDDGLLNFSTVGKFDCRVLPGKAVTVGENVPGVIGLKPIHLTNRSEMDKSIPLKELYIDIGALSRSEAEKAVKPGDEVTLDSLFDTSNGTVKGRALDDRAGCAALVDVMKHRLEYDATFAFTVQAEIGLNGAKTAAYLVDPDAAIVVDAAAAADIPGVEKEKQACRLGEGPVIPFMDRRTVYDRAYYAMAFRAAEKAGVKCQAKQAVAGGGDAGVIHTMRGGVRTVAVSLPCRYPHSAVSVISQEDFFAVPRLITELTAMMEEE